MTRFIQGIRALNGFSWQETVQRPVSSRGVANPENPSTSARPLSRVRAGGT